MAIFSYGGQIDYAIVITSSGGNSAVDIGEGVVLFNAEQNISMFGTKASEPKTGTIATLYAADNNLNTLGSGIAVEETILAPTEHGMPYKVDDITALTKVDFYRGKIGGQFVFNKITPPSGATEIVYLGLIPADQ